MKNISIITISFLILASAILVKPNLAQAVICLGPDCNAVLGGEIDLSVLAKDEDGNSITGVPVTYTWTIDPASLGVFKNNNATTWVDTNISGFSVATLGVSYSAIRGGAVNVEAAYGGNSATAKYNITVACSDDSNTLLYGIGGVSRTGANNFQYSTAEVLSTCRDEYKLYEGEGAK